MSTRTFPELRWAEKLEHAGWRVIWEAWTR
jgi:hypothetical protein